MATDPDAIDDAIQDVATNPKKVQGDEGSLEEHSIADLIAAKKHLANKDAVKNGKGWRMSKFTAPGADV